MGWSIFVAIVFAVLWYATSQFIANDDSPDVERFVGVAERLNTVLSWELVIVIALVILTVAFTINLVLLLAGAFFVGKIEFAQILDTIWKCCKNIGDKFKQLRTTAVVFGVLLTVIILSLLNSNVLKHEPGKEVPDAFWIAFGVVLSAFATAIANLVEKDDQPEKEDPPSSGNQPDGGDQSAETGQPDNDDGIDQDDENLDEVIRAIVAEEIRNARDTSPTQSEPESSHPLRENVATRGMGSVDDSGAETVDESETRSVDEGNDSEPPNDDEPARA